MPTYQLASIPVVCPEENKCGKKEKKVKKVRSAIFWKLHGNYAIWLFASIAQGRFVQWQGKNRRA